MVLYIAVLFGFIHQIISSDVVWSSIERFCDVGCDWAQYVIGNVMSVDVRYGEIWVLICFATYQYLLAVSYGKV